MQKNLTFKVVYTLFMKQGLFVLFLFVSISAFSQSEMQDFERLDIKEVRADIDTIKMEMDSTFYYFSKICLLLKKEVKLFGKKKTIQINVGIFKPYIFFIGLYLLWLLFRRK